MITQRSWVGLSLALLLPACSTSMQREAPVAPPPPVAPQSVTVPVVENYSLDLVNALLWSRTSAEARALYLQGYASAGKALDAALDPHNRAAWTAATEQVREHTGDFSKLPPAIIVDVDETVLDTSDYMLEQIVSGKGYENRTWNQYVQKANARPLPGALEFLKAASARGVTVFYVSNREVFDEAVEQLKPEDQRLYDEDEPTRANLARYGFPNTADMRTFLFRDSARGWKEKGPRRIEIAKTHRIIMLVGDNLYDLIDVDPKNQSRQSRDAALDSHRAWLGTRWIILPNPMYGSWETLYTAGKTQPDVRRAKLEAIGLSAATAGTISRRGFEP